MSSLTRNMQRKVMRKGKFTTDDEGQQVHIEHEPRPQHTIMLADGGAVTVRYTKGPLRMSGRRLIAEGRFAEFKARSLSRDQTRDFNRLVAGASRRQAEQERIEALLVAPVARVTRQMRRHAQRTGCPVPPVIGAVDEKPKRVRKPRAKKAEVA